MLPGLLSAGNGEVLRAHAQGLLNQHPLTPCLLGVNPLLNPPPNFVGCGDIKGLLQDHSMKYDEPLQVPQSILHPTQILYQSYHKASPDLPAWHIVVMGGHGREVK